MLSPDIKTGLEQLLVEYEASTTNEIAVAIIPNMGGDYIENFAEKLFKEWGVGKKDRDNGVLLLISLEQHKLRIEVGYGLEGALPDSIAQSILNNDITPRLKENNYDAALKAGVFSIIQATKGEYVAENPNKKSFEDWWVAIFIGFFVLQWFVAIFARSKSWWAGGIVGFLGGLGVGGFFGLSMLIFALTTGALTLLGLALDYAVSNAYRVAKASGKSVPYWAGGSSSHSSSGGFGGFGGGSSGGGGASGGW